MKHTNIRIARLQEMIALEEKRASLISHIDVVNERISRIQSELYGTGAATKALRIPLSKLKASGRRKGRGELKGQILEMLNAAGKTGVTVKELADRIGIKPANIHSWFSINIKKIAALKKVGAARFALNGTLAPSTKPNKKAKTGKKTRGAKKAKKGKAAKSAKVATVSPAPPKGIALGAGRVPLKARILGALKSAGSDGMTIKALAAKLNANYKNVYVWFMTTGKKIDGIKKVGPAQYKLEAA